MSKPTYSYVRSKVAPDAVGCILVIGDTASPVSYTVVGETKNIDGPALKGETTDVTNTQSPGGVKEFKRTLTDPGEVTCSVNYVPSDPGQEACQAALSAGGDTILPFQIWEPESGIVSPTNTTPGWWELYGAVVEFSVTRPLEKEPVVAIKIKVSGLPVYTPESA